MLLPAQHRGLHERGNEDRDNRPEDTRGGMVEKETVKFYECSGNNVKAAIDLVDSEVLLAAMGEAERIRKQECFLA